MVTVGDTAQLVVVRLIQVGHRKRGRERITSVEAEITEVTDHEIRAALAAAYTNTENAHLYILDRGRVSAPVAYLLGGPRERHSLGVGWEDKLTAHAAIDGYELRSSLQPGADLTRAIQQVNDARPELALVWRPMLTSKTVLERLEHAAGPASIHHIDAINAEDAFQQMVQIFEGHTVEPQAPKGPKLPASVNSAVKLAEACCDHLVFLPEVATSSGASPFIRPQAILDALKRLDEIAGQYAIGDVKTFEDAFASAGVNYAAGISQTARTKFRGHYEVTYAGETVLLGPHLRIGHGKARTCARIYWYVDRAKRLFVVGHVGQHLPDAGS